MATGVIRFSIFSFVISPPIGADEFQLVRW
jgi:hypothetical protein